MNLSYVLGIGAIIHRSNILGSGIFAFRRFPARFNGLLFPAESSGGKNLSKQKC
jgi:hypothetical protein